MRSRDRGAIDKLVNANLHFVIWLVGRFRNRGLEDMDLVAEGNVALITAVRRSGWRGECRLVIVAAEWILAAVRGAIDEQVGSGAAVP